MEKKEVATTLAEHYQKTFELTYDLWKDRNKNFIMLLIVTAAEILLIYRTPPITGVIAAIYSKLVGLSMPDAIQAINSGFPFDVLQTVMLAVILFLLIQIYHRTSHINRSYDYLEKVETDIRTLLGTDIGDVSFTREGTFYENNRPKLLKLTGFIYALLLGALLLLVVAGGTLINNNNHPEKSIIDYFILGMILIYYVSYLYLISEGAIDKILNLKNWWRNRTGNSFKYLIIYTFLIPGLIFGFISLIPLYFFVYGWIRPTLSIRWLHVIEVLVLDALFAIISSVWIIIEEWRQTKPLAPLQPSEGEQDKSR